jgi:N-acetylmuramoyl-L-alanine amidase
VAAVAGLNCLLRFARCSRRERTFGIEKSPNQSDKYQSSHDTRTLWRLMLCSERLTERGGWRRRLNGAPPAPRRGAVHRLVQPLSVLLLALLLTAAVLPLAAAPVLILDNRISRDGEDGAKLLLSMTHPADYRTFTREGGSQIVVEVVAARRASPSATLAMPQGLIVRVDVSELAGGGTRLILNLKAPARVRESYFMKATDQRDYQLVISLVAVAPKAEPPAVATQAVASTVDRPKSEPSPARDRGGDAISVTPVAAANSLVARMAPVPRPTTGRSGERAKRLPDRVVVIDPGHGGKDPGAISPAGVAEKTVTLAYARAVKKQLEAIGGYKVVLTRNNDRFLPLQDRVAIARRAGAELFLSIHADSMANPEVSGLSVYTVSERASDAEAAALAERENRADRWAGQSLKAQSVAATRILIDVLQRQTMNNTIHMAGLLVKSLEGTTPILPQRPHRFAGFVVLKAPDVPSVLIELGYLSNAADEARLVNSAHRQRVAAAIATAIDSYFGRLQVATAP